MADYGRNLVSRCDRISLCTCMKSKNKDKTKTTLLPHNQHCLVTPELGAGRKQHWLRIRI